MKQRHEICPLCGLSTTPSNMIRHMKSHENGNFEKRQGIIHVDHEGLNCKYCGRECKNKISLAQHEIRCTYDGRTPDTRNKGNTHSPYSKGLTYAQLNPKKWTTPDKLICMYCNSDTTEDNKPFSSIYSLNSHQRLCRYNPVNRSAHPERVSDLEGILDDDGKLYSKWKLKCSNAKTMGNECFLSFDDYCKLVQSAGLVSSQLGLNGESYELARYGDTGPYSLDNCRFITHKENVQEQKRVVNSVARRLKQSPEKELRRLKLEENRRLREYQEQHKDITRSGEHNPAYGSHWITNGSDNRKWYPDKESIPDGWRLGRVLL